MPDWIQTSPPYDAQVRSIRNALGMTQTQLAKRLESHQRAVNRIEAGTVSPTVRTLERVSEQLNCELRILLIPKRTIIDLLEERARTVATSIIRGTAASSALEYQKPSPEMIEDQKEELKDEILKKNRAVLWEDR